MIDNFPVVFGFFQLSKRVGMDERSRWSFIAAVFDILMLM